MGTRRTEEIIEEVRGLSYTENFSLTEGWDNNVLTDILNRSLNNVYHAITEVDNPAYIQEYVTSVVSGQQAYDIPYEVFMAIRIMDVRFLWGNSGYQFVTLKQGMIQDRFDYPINVPDMYCIRNGQILISPTPNLTKLNSLIVNYQKRMRTIDIRRGLVASRTTTPVTFTLSFVSSSQKDAQMREYADSQLDKVDYCCLVDRFGSPVVNGIPLNGYNTVTQILTADPNYIIPAAELAALDLLIANGDPIYVVRGIFASTHSDLDTQCEDYFIEYAIKRMLRLQSNSSETQEQMIEEKQILDLIINAFRRYRPSVYPVRWTDNFRRSAFPFGRRGVY
jgi:hypothetical protein